MTKIGVVGLGIGQAFFDVVKNLEDVSVSAICDLSETRLREVGEQQGITSCFTSFDEMLKTDIDVVVLATPIQVHGSQSIAALNAGKHVLCQYIAAMDMREAEDLIKASESSGCKYMFIETDCYERRNMVMRELARQGALGHPTYGRGLYLHDCKTLGKHADGSLTWRGELWMEGPTAGCRACPVHTAMPLLEIFEERVDEVFCYGPGAHTMPEFPMNDCVTIVARLPSGRTLEFVHDITSWHPHVFGYCLQGTKGCFEFDRAALLDGDQLTPWKDLDTLESEHGIGNLIKDSDGHNSAWAGCLKTLLAAIEQDSTPPQDLFDSLHITAIGWAAAESMKSRALTKVTQFD